MRYAFAALFALLIISLVIFCIAARRSKKALGKCVAFLEAALIPPVMGNLIIISTESEAVAAIGRYIYFIGMDLVMFALIRFSDSYCRANKNKHPVPRIFYILLLADALQLSLNPLFHHAFRQEPITVDRAVYYRLVPLAGQYIHRIIDYGTILAIILIFLVISLKMPRIYRERYSVIMFTIIGSGLWQTRYIFSRNPIDRSMIGFALFGIVIYYFALWYRPVQLLDRMLSNIVSEMSEALFVFDPNGHCIWANSLGCALVQVDKYSFDKAKERLTKMFGDPSRAEGSDTVTRRMRVEGQETRYYVLEESKVTDDRRKCTGTYLRVRDITEEQLRIKREMYDATHDSLTGLYDREYLYQRISEMRAANPDKQYLILFLDVKNFKIVNDIFGTEFGDYALLARDNPRRIQNAYRLLRQRNPHDNALEAVDLSTAPGGAQETADSPVSPADC